MPFACARLEAAADAVRPEIHRSCDLGPRVDGHGSLPPSAVDARREQLIGGGITDLTLDLRRLDEATCFGMKWTVGGHVRVSVIRTAGINPVLSGVFFDQ